VALLFHAASRSPVSLSALARRLGRDHHVIIVDLPGHGASSTAVSGDACLVTDFAGRVAEAVRPLARRPVVAWGAADGAIFALQFALQAPDLAAALVLDRGATAIAATASPSFASRCRALAAAIRAGGRSALPGFESVHRSAGGDEEFPAPARLAALIDGLGDCGDQLAAIRDLSVPTFVAESDDDPAGLRAATRFFQCAPQGTVELLTVASGRDPASTAQALIRKAVRSNPAAGAPVRPTRRLHLVAAAVLVLGALAPAAWILPKVAARDVGPGSNPVPTAAALPARVIDAPRLAGSHPVVDVVFGTTTEGPAAKAARAATPAATGPIQRPLARASGASRTPLPGALEHPPTQQSPAGPAATEAAATPAVAPRPSGAASPAVAPRPSGAASPASLPAGVRGEPTVPPPGRALPTGHTCDGAFAQPTAAAEVFDAVARAVVPRIAGDGEFDSCAAARQDSGR
jgi:pimeloyl-ACP methyl ester carboxylesterase